MKYRLLDNNTGVILTRSAEIATPPVCVGDGCFIAFEGAPDGSVAVFTWKGYTFYRDLVSGKCAFPQAIDGGDVDVTVALIATDGNTRRWECEGLIARRTSDGSIILAPNDANLPGEIARLRIENEAIRKENKQVRDKLDALESKLDKIMEGYNVT